MLAVVVLDKYDDTGLAELKRIRSEVDQIAELLHQLGFARDAEDLVGDGLSSSLRQRLTQWRPDSSRVLLYWAGHGRPVGDGDIWLYGKDTGQVPEPFITLTGRQLGQLLARKAVNEVVLILDACQAGVGAHEITNAFQLAVEQREYPKPLPPGLAVISSAGKDQYAQEGVFAPALIKVLREGPPHHPSQTWWTESDKFIFTSELAAAVRILLFQENARQLPEFQMFGHVDRSFFPNPRHVPYSPDVEVEAKQRRGAWLPEDIREHFMLKFRGIDTADDRGWYFAGREQPLREIVGWLRTAGSGLLVVTGPPGSGKSAVLGRLAVLSDEGYRGEAERADALTDMSPYTDPGIGAITAGIHAKNKTLIDCVGELADALGISGPPGGWHNTAELVTEIDTKIDRREQPLTLLLDALDEARPADLLAIARDLLRQLANLPNVRVLVGTRPDRPRLEPSTPDAGDGDGPLLRALTADKMVRLDADPNAIAAVADFA
jgi:hypothetical protein